MPRTAKLSSMAIASVGVAGAAAAGARGLGATIGTAAAFAKSSFAIAAGGVITAELVDTDRFNSSGAVIGR